MSDYIGVEKLFSHDGEGIILERIPNSVLDHMQENPSQLSTDEILGLLVEWNDVVESHQEKTSLVGSDDSALYELDASLSSIEEKLQPSVKLMYLSGNGCSYSLMKEYSQQDIASSLKGVVGLSDEIVAEDVDSEAVCSALVGRLFDGLKYEGLSPKQIDDRRIKFDGRSELYIPSMRGKAGKSVDRIVYHANITNLARENVADVLAQVPVVYNISAHELLAVNGSAGKKYHEHAMARFFGK